MTSTPDDPARPGTAPARGDAPRRSYDSPLRDRRSAATRDRIVAAARDRFVEEGVAEATIASIATDAEVSAPTVYATFGSKAGILEDMLYRLEERARLAEAQEALGDASSDGGARLRAFATFSRALFGIDPELLAAAVDAGSRAGAERIHQLGDRRRREALDELARSLAASDELRAGMNAERAADEAWLVSGADLYVRATRGCGWTDDHYEQWLGDHLCSRLLAANPVPGR